MSMSKGKAVVVLDSSRTKVVLLFITCLFAFPALLCGEVLTVVDSDYSVAANDSEAVEVPQFDPAVGALSEIRFTLSVDARSVRVIFDNEGSASLGYQGFRAASVVKLKRGITVFADLSEETTVQSNTGADDEPFGRPGYVEI